MIIPNLALKADAVAIKVSKEKDLMANIFFDFCCKVVQLQLQNLLRSSKYSFRVASVATTFMGYRLSPV